MMRNFCSSGFTFVYLSIVRQSILFLKIPILFSHIHVMHYCGSISILSCNSNRIIDFSLHRQFHLPESSVALLREEKCVRGEGGVVCAESDSGITDLCLRKVADEISQKCNNFNQQKCRSTRAFTKSENLKKTQQLKL